MADIKSVIKRNNERVPFNFEKITEAIFKAYSSVYIHRSTEINRNEANIAAAKVREEIERLGVAEMHVEEIQDTVEKVIMSLDTSVAKTYILYRHKHAEIRNFRNSLGINDDGLKLPINTLMVLAARYLLKDQNGKVVEGPRELFMRVANAIASAERNYNKSEERVMSIADEFYNAMVEFRFMPNSPTLMNAGAPLGQLSACFVLPVGDSIVEIFDSVKNAALVHQTGGGTGFAFSRLRPSNDVVRSTGGVASGPVSFMKVFDSATEQIKQGGKRRGANMGILRIDHPDILDFIVLKENEGVLRNFNISAAVTEEFMNALERNSDYNLVNPHTKKVVGKLNARAVWNLIITMAWKTGDPGLVFIDRINSSYANPVPSYGPVESTNPCGEQPLYPYDSCNLGSINLAKMVAEIDGKAEIDWELLERTIRTGVRFLDNVIDSNKYPLPEIERVSRSIRRIGLGVMGWADMLIKLGIKYDSNEAILLAEQVMSFITSKGRKMSEELAVERGPFPEFKNSIWYKLGYKPLRNSTVTTIAPTGTISIIAGGASQGIEPIFSVVYMRNVQSSLGYNLIEVDNEFESIAIERGFYSDELMKKLAGKSSLQDVNEIPDDVRALFVTAYDITPEWHVKMQAAFQKYTDNAVSKTINFPSWATPQEIEKAYKLAYDMGCKGITVYRDSSKSVQVLQPVERQSKITEMRERHKEQDSARMTVDEIRNSAGSYTLSPKKGQRCPECTSMMIAGEGCFTCPSCGYSKCD